MDEVIFERVATEEGWTPETQVSVLLDYIGNQQATDAFAAFLEEKRATEAEVGY